MPATAEAASRRACRRDDFHAQTARIHFRELQRFFAAGRLVRVDATLDLVDVAVELAEDNRPRFEAWLTSGAVAIVRDSEAREWLAGDARLWAVVADPWVLVQATGSP